jgi:hypothetical protein
MTLVTNRATRTRTVEVQESITTLDLPPIEDGQVFAIFPYTSGGDYAGFGVARLRDGKYVAEEIRNGTVVADYVGRIPSDAIRTAANYAGWTL